LKPVTWAALAVVCAAAPAAAEATWRTYESRDLGAAAEFPAPPALVRGVNPTSRGELKTLTFAASVGPSVFALRRADLLQDYANPEQMLDAAAARLPGLLSGRLVSSQRILVDGLPGREAVVEGKDATGPVVARWRAVIRGRFMYQSLAIGPASAPDADRQRFVRSFRLTGADAQ
jgi:hypothetical protein